MPDDLKSTFELVEYHVKYYEYMIRAILKAAGVPVDKLKFKIGSSFQKNPEYVIRIRTRYEKGGQRDYQAKF